MARRVFFSFKYEDVARAMVVRNSWVTRTREAAGFIDSADFEKLKRTGDAAIRRWIDSQIRGTSVTAVLVGAETCASRWVRYEIEQSRVLGHGLIGIDISKIRAFGLPTTERCGRIPAGCPFYLWNNNDGYTNLGTWVEAAARVAGR